MHAPSKIVCFTILTGLFASLLHETLVDPAGGRTEGAQQRIVYLSALPPIQPGNRNCSRPGPAKRSDGCATTMTRRRQTLLAGAMPLRSGSTATGCAASADQAAILKEIELARATSVGLAAGSALVAHSDRSYVVLGSFTKRGNAEKVLATHRAWNPEIAVVKIQGRIYDRVLIGPFEKRELNLVLRRAGAAGIEAPWPLAEKLALPASFVKVR